MRSWELIVLIISDVLRIYCIDNFERVSQFTHIVNSKVELMLIYTLVLYCILYKMGGGGTKVFGLFLGRHVSFAVARGGSCRYLKGGGVKCRPPNHK
jgi:hypothetical protein